MVDVNVVEDGVFQLDEYTTALHVPGHSPDSLAIFLGEEAVMVGDTILPDITPMPTQKAFFAQVREVLSPDRRADECMYGLKTYLSSLLNLRRAVDQIDRLFVFPGHRLFYRNQWNEVILPERITQIIEHHIQRCGDILRLLKKGPMTAREIATVHFEPPLLAGMGIFMAENEILSHCELLVESGDLLMMGGERFASTGTTNFESVIGSLRMGCSTARA